MELKKSELFRGSTKKKQRQLKIRHKSLVLVDQLGFASAQKKVKNGIEENRSLYLFL